MEDKNSKEARKEDVQQRYLSEDLIIEHILPCMHIKTLTQCKLLSKLFNATISNPNFILNHFSNSLFSDPFTPVESLFIQSGNSAYIYNCDNHDDNDDVEGNSAKKLVRLPVEFDERVELVGCSNGLVCLGEFYGRYFYLYNPATNQSHKYYPNDGFMAYFTCWGFGYISSADDFKVVRIILNQQVVIVYVFSLKMNTWKKIEHAVLDGAVCVRGGLLANETLYWKMFDKIVAFDLARETFKIDPHLVINSQKDDVLCVMGGCLCKCISNSRKDLIFEIVKRNGRVGSVRFSCGLRIRYGDYELIGFTETGKVIVVNTKRNMLGLLDKCSKRTIATFKNKGRTHIRSYVPTQCSPLPSAE